MEGPNTAITIHLDPNLLDALDAWIERHGEPRMAREDAAVRIMAGRLASDWPSTIVPNFATGRDLE
jgi:hypothetical protein